MTERGASAGIAGLPPGLARNQIGTRDWNGWRGEEGVVGEGDLDRLLKMG